MLEVHPRGSVLEIAGSLDEEGAREFLAAVQRVDGDVQVDGSRLREIDGAGLTALVIARQMCRERHASFEIVRLAPDAVSHLRARRQLPRLFAATAPEHAPEAPAPLVDAPASSSPAPSAPSAGSSPASSPARARNRWFAFRHGSR